MKISTASHPTNAANLSNDRRRRDSRGDIGARGTETAVAVESVTKIYGEGARAVRALDAVDLLIKDNEFFTLLGPSGCGKTTMLRCIAGFEHLSAGRILLFGDEIGHLPPDKRPVNTVFQQYALFPHMTVRANVSFGLRMLRRPSAEITEVVDRVLALVHMEQLADRRPNQLSGGQQQRVALARALATQPKVLLLDEPLSALDLKLRQQMRLELKQLQVETGITFIFVTHDQEEALTMSDRIAVMSEGHVQQIGTPEEIYERPINHFVADFIGQTNFLEAEIERIEGGFAICRGPGGARVVAKVTDGCDVGKRIDLSIRPEKISLAPPSGEQGELRGIVERPIYLGTDTHFPVRLDDGMIMLVRVQNAHGGNQPVTVGSAVALNFDAGAAWVLVD